MDERLQLSPKFAGARFEHHSIPVELLPDLAAYRDLVKEVAKHLYKAENPQRKRVPSAFEATFKLALREIKEGSAVPVLVNEAEGEEEQKVAEFVSFFERAKVLVDGTIRSAGDPNGVMPREFPFRLLSKFANIGKNLKPGEVIDFAHGSNTEAKFTGAVRQTLSLWATDEVENPLEIVAHVTGVNTDPNDTFEAKLEDGRKVLGPRLPEMSEEIFAACKNKKRCLRIVGLGIFDKQNQLQRISEVQEIETLDGQALELYRATLRLREMTKLPVGWCDGQGGPFSADAVTWFEGLLTAFVDAYYLPTPSVFPTPNGELQMEWNWEGGSTDVRINPTNRRASVASFSAKGDVEEELPVVTPQDIETLATVIAALVPVGGLDD